MVLRALWALPVSDLAGVARHVLDVTEVGIPGAEVTVLMPAGPLAERLRAGGVDVIERPFGPGHGLTASLRSLREANRLVEPRLIHTHLSYADVVGAIGKPHGVRLVTTEHGIAADDLVYHGSGRRARVMAQAHRVRMHRFDEVIAVSDATAGAMRDKWRTREPIRVIRNGIDPRSTMAPPRAADRDPRILSLCRLAPEKGLDELLESFALLLRERPAASLVIAGEGPLGPALRERARSLGIADRVSFPGFLDAAAALAHADVLAQLSVWENCSYSLLDAAAGGLGVVATKVGGNPEVLPAHCLVDSRDPAGVAAALLRQAARLEDRPGLSEWPTRANMTARLAEVYAAAVGTAAGTATVAA